MMGWYGGGVLGAGSWIGMGLGLGLSLGLIVFWGLVIFAIVALLRRSSKARQRGVHGAPAPAADPSEALQTLDGRFASGDLTEEEYRHTRETLLVRCTRCAPTFGYGPFREVRSRTDQAGLMTHSRSSLRQGGGMCPFSLERESRDRETAPQMVPAPMPG